MAVWSSGGDGWGNGTNVATDNNPGTVQTTATQTGRANQRTNVYAFGSPITPGQKVQFEIVAHQGGGVKSPWWFLQTAISAGVSNSGGTLLIGQSYNQGVILNGVNSANNILDPESDFGNNFGAGWPGSPIQAAPSWWIDGTRVTFLVDRIANQMTFIVHGATGASIGGHTYGTSGTFGPFDISSFGSATVYPWIIGWYMGQPSFTILGGGSGQTLSFPQTGYTNLDGGTVVGTGMTAISTPVMSPNPVVAGAPDTIVVTATGGPFSSAANTWISIQLTGAAHNFVTAANQAAGGAVVLSNSNLTATFTGMISTVASPHDVLVYDAGNLITSPVGTLNVNASVSQTVVPVNSPAIRVSPFVWAGDTGRAGALSRTTAAVGAWIDFYVNTSSAPALQINLSTTGGAVKYDYLLGGTIAQTAIADIGSPLNISGLTASGANQWVRLYLGADGGTLSPTTVSGMTIDAASTAGTAPAALQSLLFVGDGICQPFGLEAVQSFVYLMAKSLGLSTWDMVDSSYGGNGWITGSEGTDPYDQPSVTSRWNLVYPGSVSNLDSTGIISALGGTNTPPHAICFFLGASDCLAAVSTTALTTAITAAMAGHRAATSPSTALIILMPFGLYDTVAYPTGPTYVTAITAAVTAANAAGSKVVVADPGSAFGISMRTGGYLGVDNKTPLATGHTLLAATYLPLILPLLSGVAVTPATITVTVPSPLVAGIQPVYGTLTNGTDPANLWLAWSPNQYIVTANAVLATISGSSFSATMNLTAPSTSTSGGKSIGNAVASSMWYSTNANQATVTITDPALGIITVPSPIADQLQAAPVTFQIGFNYLPTANPTTLAPGVNVGISIVPTGVAPIFTPLATSTALPVGAAITVPTSIANQQTNQFFSVQVGFNYVPNQANLFYTPVDVATTSIIGGVTVCPFSAGLSNGGTITFDVTGQLCTFKFKFGSTNTWAFQIYDQSGAGVKSSSVTFVTQTATGGGGTYTVPAPTAPLQVGNANVIWSPSGQLATITIANAVLGTFDLQIQDSTYPNPILSPIVTYNVTAVATAAAATLTVPTPAAPILLQDSQNGTWTQAPGNWAIATVATSQTLTLNLSNNTTLTKAVALGVVITNQQIQLYTFFLFSPPQIQPNVPVTLFGEFVAGTPTQIDYTTNGGATWVLAPAANVSITAITAQNPSPPQVAGINTPVTTPTLGAATGAFSVLLPLGVAAGTYAAGQIMVRDHNVTSVFASAGTWVVSAFTMASLTTGLSIFDFDPAIPACITLNTDGTVRQMIDASGSGRHMSIGPTALPAAPALGTTTLVRAPGADVLDAACVGPEATFVHLSGADGTRTLVGFTPTSIADNVFDPTANFASFGALGGPNDLVINLFQSSSFSVGTQTVVEAIYIDPTVFGGTNAGYGIGLIWGDWITSTTVQYVTPGRWHASNFAAQFDDSVTAMFLSTGTTISVATWGVVTMQRSGTLFQWRINKGPWFVMTITSTGAFNPTGCFWGGSVSNGLNQPGGNALRLCGAFHIIQGVLSAAELASVESLTGQSVGLAI